VTLTIAETVVVWDQGRHAHGPAADDAWGEDVHRSEPQGLKDPPAKSAASVKGGATVKSG